MEAKSSFQLYQGQITHELEELEKFLQSQISCIPVCMKFHPDISYSKLIIGQKHLSDSEKGHNHQIMGQPACSAPLPQYVDFIL